MNARSVGVGACVYLAASCLFSSLAWCQTDSARPPASLDATPIGKVMTASGTVHIEHPSAIVVQANLAPSGENSKTGDLVYRNDVVQTGTDGAINIAFVDGTSFNVSKNAKMSIDSFVYDPKGNSNSALLSLTKGTFTFIAGNVAHTGDMKVDTPIGTMGIRGTAPRVEILDDGTTKFTTLIEQK
jgi:hypothetical protein